MILLFFDTYYIDGLEHAAGWYAIAKDFVVPFLAIIFPVAITWYITSRDRRINAKNRSEDLKRYEGEKKELFLSQEKLRRKKERQVLHDFQFFFVSMKDILNAHLETLDKIIGICTLDKLPTLSVAVFTNEHLYALKSMDPRLLVRVFDKRDFAQYLTSIELLENLYSELRSIIKEYKKQYVLLEDGVETNLSSLFYEMDKLSVDPTFDQTVASNLASFRENYSDYVEKYDPRQDIAFPAYLMKSMGLIANEEFFKVSNRFPVLSEIVRDLQLSLFRMERFCLSYQNAFRVAKNGFVQHRDILSDITVFFSRIHQDEDS